MRLTAQASIRLNVAAVCDVTSTAARRRTVSTWWSCVTSSRRGRSAILVIDFVFYTIVLCRPPLSLRLKLYSTWNKILNVVQYTPPVTQKMLLHDCHSELRNQPFACVTSAFLMSLAQPWIAQETCSCASIKAAAQFIIIIVGTVVWLIIITGIRCTIISILPRSRQWRHRAA